MIKLIMSDMDGTLLDEYGNVPKRFDEVMEKIVAKGILFAPASGRQYYELLRKFDHYKDSFIFIAENGSYVGYQGEEIFSSSLNRDSVNAMLNISAKIPQVKTVLCGKKSAYVLSDLDNIFWNEIEKYYARCKAVDSFDDVDDDVLKIALCDLSEKGAEYNSYPYYTPYRDVHQVVLSGQLWMDIMNLGTNKGVASLHIQKVFGFKPEECMAFGDYMNDYELLKTVYHSYAMENAHPKLKEVARFKAKSNVEDGVLEVIEAMIDSETHEWR